MQGCRWNPVAALISIAFQSKFEWGTGRSSDGFKYTLNFQPVIPISISEHWNLISRTIVPVIHQDDVVLDTQDGMGDVLQSVFFSPKAPGPNGWIVGGGPVVLLPTSTTRTRRGAAPPSVYKPNRRTIGQTASGRSRSSRTSASSSRSVRNP